MLSKNAIDRIEIFLDRLSSGEYKLSQQAYELMFPDRSGNKQTLAYNLYMSINYYERSKSMSAIHIASEYFITALLDWISLTWAKEVILDNTDLVRKLKEKEEENRILKGKNKQLTDECKEWKEQAEKYGSDLVYVQGQYDDLEKQLNRAFKGDRKTYGK